MLLQEITNRRLVTAQPDDTIVTVAEKMKEKNVGAVVITENDEVVGIVTDRDIALQVVAGETSPDDRVSEIMTRDVKTIWEDQGVFNATQYLSGYKFRRLPVVDRRNRPVGMVTVDDLFGLFAREMFNVASALEPAIGEHV